MFLSYYLNKQKNLLVKKTEKQKQFMNQYEAIHNGFVRYCKAKSYSILPYEDLVNESVTRAFEGFAKLKDKELFAAYIYGIAKNIIKNELRKRTHAQKYNIYKEERESATVNQAEKSFEIEILYKALNQLPESQKEAIILFEISGYSINEITKIQDSSLSAVKQRLKRGREKLKDIICISEEEKRSLSNISRDSIQNSSALILLISLISQNV